MSALQKQKQQQQPKAEKGRDVNKDDLSSEKKQKSILDKSAKTTPPKH